MSKVIIPKHQDMEKTQLEHSSFQHKAYIQIKKTMNFEAKKNKGKFIVLMAVVGIIYSLSYLINYLQENLGAVAPENLLDYFGSFLTMIDLLTLILAVSYAGSIIVEDFEKQTGNLLFPKIQKDRLLFGRFLMRYIFAAINMLAFYGLVALTTYLKYKTSLPIQIINSYAWAILYLFTMMAFATLFSALMKKTSTSIITTMLLVLMVFQILTLILRFTGSDVEPFFILTYYANIITACFDMPSERFSETSLTVGPGGAAPAVGTGELIYVWSTPSFQGALLGMLVWAGICLIIAYYLYKNKQNSE